MDHFESLIKLLLERKGFWVLQSHKVNLTKEEKVQVNKHSIPRVELDLIAFNQKTNELLVLEVKSLLDSYGVKLSDLKKKFDIQEGNYKMFTCENYRTTVFKRLKKDLIHKGLINEKTKIVLGLAAGQVYQDKSEEMRTFCKSQNWYFWSPEEIRNEVLALADEKYENNPVIMTAKLLKTILTENKDDQKRRLNVA